ncbi:8-oxo-dGDP phosphatase NUDT18 isoform X1 [Arapaima gigas]
MLHCGVSECFDHSPAMSVEDAIQTVLDGGGLQTEHFDSSPETVQPVVLRKTVCYIVCAVIFNEKNEVLMVQEAKLECHGRWYLPAGRMERSESIVEAMMREVKEEAGLDCQPITLLRVEEQGPQWIRFVLLAEETGGSLKTEAEADTESIQAQWWDQESPLPLRGRDILCLIDAGLKYRKKPWFTPVLPVDLPCHTVCQRLLLTLSGPSGDLWVLLSCEEEDPHLPVAVSDRAVALTWAAHKLMQECMPFSSRKPNLKTWGILGVQHNGRSPGKTDGVCFNTLVSVDYNDLDIDAGQPPFLENHKFQWHKLDSPHLREKIEQRLSSGSIIPMHSFF